MLRKGLLAVRFVPVLRVRLSFRTRGYATTAAATSDEVVGQNLLPLVNKLQSVFAMSKVRKMLRCFCDDDAAIERRSDA